MKFLKGSKAVQRYTQRFFVAMPTYVVALFATMYVLKRTHPSQIIACLLALLPALPILAIVAIVGLYLKEEGDEFQRDLLQQALLWAIGATLSVTTVWGLLEMYAEVPHLPSFFIFPMFWFFVGVLSPFLRRRYRVSSDE